MSRSGKCNHSRSHSIDRTALVIALAFGTVQPAIFTMPPVHAETVVQSVETDVDLPKLNVTVEDKDGNELDGATVGLYSDSQAVTLLKSAKTDKGTAEFDTELKINQNYYLKEIKGVSGYEQDNTIHVLKITEVSPTSNVLKFSYDGKSYSLNDQGSCHVIGDWGSHIVVVNIVNQKPSNNTADTANTNDENGTSGTNANSSSGANGSNSQSPSSASNSNTGKRVLATGGVLAGIAVVVGCIAAATRKHKKSGGE